MKVQLSQFLTPKVSESKVNSDLISLWESKKYSIEEINKKLKNIHFFDNPEDTVKNTHAIAILTEWDIFKNLNFKKFFDIMKTIFYI